MYRIIKIIILTLIGTLSILFFYILLFSNITFLGHRYNNFIEVLDLSNLPINEDRSWEDGLSKFKRLKKVIVNDQTISIEKKQELQDRYPNIFFAIASTATLQGETYRDDAEFIELTNHVTESIIDELANFTELKELVFPDNFHDKDIQLVLTSMYPYINYVWNVDIYDKTVNSKETRLDLTGAQITDLEKFKKDLKLLPNLVYLDLSDCNLDNETLYNLRNDFPNTKIVWRLHLRRWSLKTDQIAFSVLITNYNYVPINSEDLEIFKYCTDLQALDLGHQNITDITAIGKYLPDLRLLIIADNPISDISPLASLKHLHYLELFITKISDISPLINNTELVDLNLSNDYHVKDFSVLLDNDFPLLERLWINNTGIPYNDYKKLKQKYPNVTIVTEGNSSTHFGWREHERYYAMIKMFHNHYYISELFTKYDSPD